MKAPVFRAVGRRAPRFIAAFDSTSAMVRALGNYLHGKDFPGLGGTAPPSEFLAAAVNALPRAVREQLYIWSGWGEAIPVRRLGDVRAEEISRWVVNSYPKRLYPAAAIGSASGALVHLWAALGIPWLPQTFLVPVRRSGVPPDEPRKDLEWSRQHAWPLLEANPDIQLHHMHDPNQDRLMVQRMTYFRVKRLTLGEAYERFLKETLSPGGTLFLVECRRTWPTTKVAERFIFQFGALGGATPEEFHHGSDRVAAYLERYGSDRRRWDPPEPDGDRPEAEWGFEPALGQDVERFARERGYRLRRIVFEEPEHPSPLVADLYRWWYHERGYQPSRLLVESFIVLEPYWALRTGSVPFWMKFNMEPSLAWVHRFVDQAGPFDEIYLMLFAHGVDAVGLPGTEQWRSLIQRARRRGSFVGVDERRFPRDFGVYARYYPELKRKIPARYPIPGPLAQNQLEEFLTQAGGNYPVRWIEHPVGAPSNLTAA
jgi:hypothetical protein